MSTSFATFTSLALFTFTGWPTKMSLFFFGNNFYKNKEIFNIFSPQILEVYRILLVETTLELIMFYYTFSVINTMFVPCTALLYDSTAVTRTLKLSVHNSFEHFLWNSSDFSSHAVLSCLRIVFTNSLFQVLPQKIVITSFTFKSFTSFTFLSFTSFSYS